jgi:hypothetical protein
MTIEGDPPPEAVVLERGQGEEAIGTGMMSQDGPKPEASAQPKAKYFVAVPCHDFKIDVVTMRWLFEIQTYLASRGGVAMYQLCGNSNIAEARNRIAHMFLRHSPCEEMICIDSDMAGTLDDLKYLLEGPEDLVIAPYARKVLGSPPNKYGFGFVRIHRRIFQTLADWMYEGQEALPRWYCDGEIAVDYFKTGATSDNRWFGEDTGFWHYCALNELKPRYENRCRLGHIGRFVYGYPKTPGIILESDAAQ